MIKSMKVQLLINSIKKGSAISELFDWPFPLPEKEDCFCITEIQKLTKITFQVADYRQNANDVKEWMEGENWCYYDYRNFRVSDNGETYIELNFEQKE